MQVQIAVEQKLKMAFQPEHLEVINESSSHNVPPGSESHFKVIMVSPAFSGANLVARHRQVYTVLAEEMKSSIHALSLQIHTPEEWTEKVSQSPPCLGGDGSSK